MKFGLTGNQICRQDLLTCIGIAENQFTFENVYHYGNKPEPPWYCSFLWNLQAAKVNIYRNKSWNYTVTPLHYNWGQGVISAASTSDDIQRNKLQFLKAKPKLVRYVTAFTDECGERQELRTVAFKPFCIPQRLQKENLFCTLHNI